MCTLENVFYEDMDPKGEQGSVTTLQMEQYFTTCRDRGNTFHLLMTQWFNDQLDSKQRRAFLQFCIEQAGTKINLSSGQSLHKIRYPFLLQMLEDCFKIRC